MRTFLLSAASPVLASLCLMASGCESSEDTATGLDDTDGHQIAVDTPDAAPVDVMRDAGSAAMDAAPVVPADAGGSDAGAEPVVCKPFGAPTACPTPAPRYGDVAPIVRERCVICHAGHWGGEWPLDAYSHLADWADDIRSNLVNCTMPPPAANVPMTQEERMTILNWLRCGLPR